jgi:hypothetical protein
MKPGLFAFFVLLAIILGCGGGGGGPINGTNGTIPPPGTNVQGKVVVQGGVIGVPGIVVQFFNAAGGQIAQTTTLEGGIFYANVPPGAVRFHLDPASINPSAYYRAYWYSNKNYSALIPSCRAPMPAYTQTSITHLAEIRIPSTSQPPPPPPDGC